MQEFDPNVIYQKLVKSGEDWAEKEALAQQMEEMKKAILSNLKLQSTASSEAAKETWAYAQPEYETHIRGMTEARKMANLARVRYHGMKVLSELRRTEQSNLRTERKYSGMQT